MNRQLVTLTIDPARFGAVPIGTAWWDRSGRRLDDWEPGARPSTLWSSPTRKQFQAAAAAMSEAFEGLNKRLRSKAKRQGVERHGYFRVVELHRNGWPHYHVLIEHPIWTSADIQTQVRGWDLGSIVEAQDVDVDEAVGELAPYLVSKERGKGHKAYQFAATALPKGFRLYSTSEGFLLPRDTEPSDVEHVQVLRGHFHEHHRAVEHWGGDARIVLHPPAAEGQPHRPPGATVATGDGARDYYLAQLAAQPVTLDPDQAQLLAIDDDLPAR
jgi:hypothetical protein